MYSPDGVPFAIQNMASIAREAIPTCDLTLPGMPTTANYLGGTFRPIAFLSYVTGVRPQVTAYQDDAFNLVLVIAGVGSQRDFQEVTTGSLSPAQHPKIAGKFNRYTLLWVAAVDAFVALLPGQVWRSVYVLGHSLGGTVAPLVAAGIFNRGASPRVSILSTGAPRYCDFTGARATFALDYLRIMNYGDPTPMVPPRYADAPAAYLVLSRSEVQAWLELVHAGNYLAFDGDGSVTSQEYPLGIASPLQFNLSVAWQFYQASTIPSHAMERYADRLDNLVASTGPGRLHNVPMGTVNTGPIVGREAEEIQKSLRAVVKAPSPSGTTIRVKDAAAWVRIRRIGRRYYVYAGETSIYAATSKRDARAVARALRLFMVQYLQNPDRFANPEDLVNLFMQSMDE